MCEIKLGKYRHYKGNLYEVVGFARHSETLEEMVVYKPLYQEGGIWVRPSKMWNEPVEVGGGLTRRFEYIENNAATTVGQKGGETNGAIVTASAVPAATVNKMGDMGESAAAASTDAPLTAAMIGEQVNVIFENERIRVEEIVSNGATSAADFWYDNTIDEWVRVTQGSAILELKKPSAHDLEEIALNRNENYYIKAHQKHRVKYVSPDCRWLCVYVKK